MNTRFFTLIGAVSVLALAACSVTSGSDSGSGGSGGGSTSSATSGNGGATSSSSTTSTTATTGTGGTGGGAACGNCLEFAINEEADTLCEDDAAANAAYDALVACVCDPTAGCGAACGDNICDQKTASDACQDCVENGACKTVYTACTHN